MRKVIGIAALSALAACGPSEDEIRADERTKMLEERVAELEAEKDAEAKNSADQEEEAPEPEAEPETEKAPEPPAPSPSQESMVANGSAPQMRLIATYNAFIGQDDLYNSNGKRLTAPWQVLRQDRANYHRYGVSQPGDESDPFFSSAKNRGIMERMVANGTIERSAGRRIVNGNVSVRVEVYGTGSSGQRVNVTVR